MGEIQQLGQEIKGDQGSILFPAQGQAALLADLEGEHVSLGGLASLRPPVAAACPGSLVAPSSDVLPG